MSHLTYTLLVALLLSGASGLGGDRGGRERAAAAAYTFLSCTLFLFAGGWLMYWIHG